MSALSEGLRELRAADEDVAEAGAEERHAIHTNDALGVYRANERRRVAREHHAMTLSTLILAGVSPAYVGSR